MCWLASLPSGALSSKACPYSLIHLLVHCQRQVAQFLQRRTKEVSVDKSSFTGILLAIGGIVAGLILEGGNLRQILQPTAAMIVFGGTLGAVMLQFPLSVVLQALRRLGSVFFTPGNNPQATIRRLVKFAQKARREGIV